MENNSDLIQSLIQLIEIKQKELENLNKEINELEQKLSLK